MYSVVMLMAMSGAPEAPALFKRNKGCDGGCQGQAAACYGGNGCRGQADNCGCQGGGRRSRRDRGCGGGGCAGYTASCGCQGYQASCCQQASCGCGGYQAAGGCVGYQAAGCGSYGGAIMTAPPATTSPPPAMPPKGKEAMIAAPATIIVNLPAEATLKIDGFATKQTSAVREFTTPTLAAGQSFVYNLTAEVVRDGKTVSSSQQIVVRAGETSKVSLPVDLLVVMK